MFEPYTEPSKRVVVYARYMALQAGSQAIETEHLLLGILRTDMVLARRFLGTPWAAEEIWQEIERRNIVRPALSVDIPLSTEAKRTFALAAEEADGLSSKKIHTEHLLLALLRNEECLGSVLLRRRGMQLAATREELRRNPHDDSQVESFTRESPPLPEAVIEERARIKSIQNRMEQAIANRDLRAARSCSEEERIARDRLRSLYEDRGLSGWLFE